jgi:hypothetical protein
MPGTKSDKFPAYRLTEQALQTTLQELFPGHNNFNFRIEVSVSPDILYCS